MCRRCSPRCIRLVLLFILYNLISKFLAHILGPNVSSVFISEDLSVGLKYTLIYLKAGAPMMSDSDGAEVFSSRGCGQCFLTDNPGFAPLIEYDAVLTMRIPKKDFEIDREKLFILRTSPSCVRRKLKECETEPKVWSLRSNKSMSLCEMCEVLKRGRSRDKRDCSYPENLEINRSNVEDESEVNVTSSDTYIL